MEGEKMLRCCCCLLGDNPDPGKEHHGSAEGCGWTKWAAQQPKDPDQGPGK